jgi:uncharacterized Zn finger protein (UPF0148 family)
MCCEECGAPFRGFVFGNIVCPDCERSIRERAEEEEGPDPGVAWYDTSDELK